jgi:hypothetical protein
LTKRSVQITGMQRPSVLTADDKIRVVVVRAPLGSLCILAPVVAIEDAAYRASFDYARPRGRRWHSEVRVWDADDRIPDADPTGGRVDICPLQREHLSHA